MSSSDATHPTGTSTAAPPLAGSTPTSTSTTTQGPDTHGAGVPSRGAGAGSGTGTGAGVGADSTAPGTHSGTVPTPASSSNTGSATGTGSGTGKLSTSEAQAEAIPGHAGMDPEIPKSASEAPVFGVEGGKEVPFGEQVKGHAKYFAGKIFGKDHEVQQGAARVRGESHTLPEDVKHPRMKQAEQEMGTQGTQTQGGQGAQGGQSGI